MVGTWNRERTKGAMMTLDGNDKGLPLILCGAHEIVIVRTAYTSSMSADNHLVPAVRRRDGLSTTQRCEATRERWGQSLWSLYSEA